LSVSVVIYPATEHRNQRAKRTPPQIVCDERNARKRIAALAGIGESKIPKNEYKTPAAINGQKRVSHQKKQIIK
jgi:hypothetical protein